MKNLTYNAKQRAAIKAKQRKGAAILYDQMRETLGGKTILEHVKEKQNEKTTSGIKAKTTSGINGTGN